MARMSGEVEEACRRVAAERHNVIGRREAYECGHVPRSIRRRTRAGKWHVVFPDAFTIGPPTGSWAETLAAACESARGVAFRRSAAALHRFPAFPRREVEVVTPRSRLSLNGVGVHRTRYLPDEDVTTVDGIPVTSPARTVLDLCSVCDHRRMRGLMLHLIDNDEATPSEFVGCMDRTARCGRPGSALYRRLVGELDLDSVLPASYLEDRAFAIVVSAGYPEPERQYSIRAGGVFLGRVDLAFPQWRVAIEVDGWDAHRSKTRFLDDRARQNGILSHRWIVVRFTARDVARPRRFLADLERAIAFGQDLAASGLWLPR